MEQTAFIVKRNVNEYDEEFLIAQNIPLLSPVPCIYYDISIK